MNHEELNSIIKKLEQISSKEDAYFEFNYDDLPDYETIRANRDGLIIYSLSLLKSIEKFDEKSEKKEENEIDGFIKFEIDNWFVNDNFSLPYIKPIFLKRSEIVIPETESQTWKNKVQPYIFILVLLIAVASFFVGFIEIINWIF